MMAVEGRGDGPGAWAFVRKRDISSTGTEAKVKMDAHAYSVVLVG